MGNTMNSHNDVDSPTIVSSRRIEFAIGDKRYALDPKDLSAETSLNEYLRDNLHLTGTKKMCLEGGCGACIVVVSKPDPVTNIDKLVAVNSCLVSILTCHGWNIHTIEGIGGPTTKYHPIQETLANFNGTQCGFCSPGMVMNMYALYENDKLTMKEIENSFGSNICRCTGYRPILTAFKSLSKDASVDLLGKYPDIEDLGNSVSVCKKLCGERSCKKNIPIVFQLRGSKWIKVYSLKDLLSTLHSLGKEETYMLVAGNTAQGVYKPVTSPSVYIDIIEVKELCSYEIKNEALVLGGNVSLTDTMELFNKLGTEKQKFSYLKTMAEHIDLIAHVPVRNIGTLAGNLMMKHTHHEFPSDVFLLLETFGAKFTIVNSNGNEVTKTPLEFLKFDMKLNVLKHIILKSLSDSYKYQTFKIMPRAQNAHAMVNAGFLFKFDANGLCESASVVYGNINPKFTHAVEAEQFLVGKSIFDNITLQNTFRILQNELDPYDVIPEPSPEFRKKLAISLFYKAILSLAPDDKLSPKNKSGRSKLKRPISSGVQDYQTYESLYPLTKAIPKIEALAQTSGQAQYIDDIPDLPHQLYGKFILANASPNSVILKIDTKKALELDDVIAFFGVKDIPGQNNFYPAELGATAVEEIFCKRTIKYYDQPIGIIVGTTKKAAAKASKMVEVTYDTPKPLPLTSIREVLKSGRRDRITKLKHYTAKRKGTNIQNQIDGQFDLGTQYHFHMETHCCLVVPTEDGIDMFTSTQWMDCNQIAAANMLNIENSKINVSVRRCGGGFGGKVSRNAQISCAAALAAWKLRKPVRMSLTLGENMQIIGKRWPLSGDYRVGVDNFGLIQYLTSQVYVDQGSGGNDILIDVGLAIDMFNYNYDSSTYDTTVYSVRTDTHANTWTRAPGSVEGMAMIEAIMDHIAYDLGLDPLEVREANMTTQLKLLGYVSDLKDWADVDERKEKIAYFNKTNRWKKRGLSLVPMIYSFIPVGAISVRVSIFHGDGSVSITHGGIEIGQGINTKAAQVCAYKLNIPLEKVSVAPSTSNSCPNSGATAASMTSEAVCYGIDRACDELLERMAPYRTDDNQTWEKLCQTSYLKFVNLCAGAIYSPTAPYVSPYLIYGTCVAEVIIDILTGQHLILRVDLIEDTGTTLSPDIDVGQVEGAFIMGLGFFTTEKIVFDQNGQIVTNNTWYYKPPGAKDIPIDFRIKFPKNNSNPLGVLQSKAVAEPPLCLAVSVPLAIRNAVASARMDSDPKEPKWYPFDGPSSVENTFMKSLNDIKSYIL